MSTINKYPTIKQLFDLMTDDEKTFIKEVFNTKNIKVNIPFSVLPENHEICIGVLQPRNYPPITGILWNTRTSAGLQISDNFFIIDVFSGQNINIYNVVEDKYTRINEYTTLLEARYWLEGGVGGTSYIHLLYDDKELGDPTSDSVNSFVLSQGYSEEEFNNLKVVINSTKAIWIYITKPTAEWIAYGSDYIEKSNGRAYGTTRFENAVVSGDLATDDLQVDGEAVFVNPIIVGEAINDEEAPTYGQAKSYVVANGESEATEELTKITIGKKTYKIPSGAGNIFVEVTEQPKEPSSQVIYIYTRDKEISDINKVLGLKFTTWAKNNTSIAWNDDYTILSATISGEKRTLTMSELLELFNSESAEYVFKKTDVETPESEYDVPLFYFTDDDDFDVAEYTYTYNKETITAFAHDESKLASKITSLYQWYNEKFQPLLVEGAGTSESAYINGVKVSGDKTLIDYGMMVTRDVTDGDKNYPNTISIYRPSNIIVGVNRNIYKYTQHAKDLGVVYDETDKIFSYESGEETISISYDAVLTDYASDRQYFDGDNALFEYQDTQDNDSIFKIFNVWYANGSEENVFKNLSETEPTVDSNKPKIILVDTNGETYDLLNGSIVRVSGTLVGESYVNATLSSEQLEKLSNSASILELKFEYLGEEVTIKHHSYTHQGNYRYYEISSKSYTFTTILNMTSGALNTVIDYVHINDELVISGESLPSDADVGILHENSITGSLHQMKNRPAGLYDEKDELIVSWENSGIDSECSNAGEIISTNYPDTRIVRISTDVQTIASNGFVGASAVTKLLVPDSVTTINNGAFSGMIGLTEISLPFIGTTRDSTSVAHTAGIIFNQSSISGTTQCKQYINSTTYHSNYIPSNLTRIIIRHSPSGGGIRAFCGWRVEAQVILLNSTEIEQAMFRDAYVTSVEIHPSDDGQFKLYAEAFKYSRITSVVLPPTTTLIAETQTISSIWLLTKTPPTLSGVLAEVSNIYVPSGTLEAYQNDSKWSAYSDIMSEADTEIPDFTDELKEWKKIPDESEIGASKLYAHQINAVNDNYELQFSFISQYSTEISDLSVLGKGIDSTSGAYGGYIQALSTSKYYNILAVEGSESGIVVSYIDENNAKQEVEITSINKIGDTIREIM